MPKKRSKKTAKKAAPKKAAKAAKKVQRRRKKRLVPARSSGMKESTSLLGLYPVERFPRRGPHRLSELEQRLDSLEADSRSSLVEARRLGSRVEDVAYQLSTLMPKWEELAHRSHLVTASLEGRITEVLERGEALKKELHSYLAIQSLGLDPDQCALHRFIPVRLYLSEDFPSVIDRVMGAAASLIESAGFGVASEYQAESGSWFKRVFWKSTEAMTRPEFLERIKKVERAVELATLQKTQAEIDKNQSDAASTLIRSLEGVPSGICQIGSILIIKCTDSGGQPRVVARSLTQAEMMYLERNQKLLHTPEFILEALSTVPLITDVAVDPVARIDHAQSLDSGSDDASLSQLPG